MVYLIHFDRPLSHAKHYLGFTEDITSRLEAHAAGQGARLMQVLKERGITWRLARTWDGDRRLERQLKNRKESPRLCPICRQHGEDRGSVLPFESEGGTECQ